MSKFWNLTPLAYNTNYKIFNPHEKLNPSLWGERPETTIELQRLSILRVLKKVYFKFYLDLRLKKTIWKTLSFCYFKILIFCSRNFVFQVRGVKFQNFDNRLETFQIIDFLWNPKSVPQNCKSICALSLEYCSVPYSRNVDALNLSLHHVKLVSTNDIRFWYLKLFNLV